MHSLLDSIDYIGWLPIAVPCDAKDRACTVSGRMSHQMQLPFVQVLSIFALRVVIAIAVMLAGRYLAGRRAT